MDMLYNTADVPALDAYDYVQERARTEVAAVDLRGRRPGQLSAKMSVARFGDFAIEDTTWFADSELVAHRTERLIRAGESDCCRLFLSVEGGVRMEQAGIQTIFRPNDIAFYDMSRRCQCIHTIGPMRVVMLTFPHRSVPIGPTAVKSIVGTVVPRNQPGRDLLAQFLVELADLGAAAKPEIDPEIDPELTDLLPSVAVGLIRRQLGQPDGITLPTLRRLQMARVHAFMRRHLDDTKLDPDRIARAVNMSTRSLHTLFQDTEHTPMRLLKRLRLQACHRSLRDPDLAAKPIKEIIATHGYFLPDQFARDFKQQFGVSPRKVRP